MLPDVPPLADTIKGFSIDTWWGLVAPAATPKDVIAKLNKAFTDALRAPETQTRFKNLLAEPVATTPKQFEDFMAAERAKYKPLVAASGAKVD
jgi:tripartite-type tricarboxylate transporter receptor subunit TctC